MRISENGSKNADYLFGIGENSCLMATATNPLDSSSIQAVLAYGSNAEPHY
jgi:hypothetical protein